MRSGLGTMQPRRDRTHRDPEACRDLAVAQAVDVVQQERLAIDRRALLQRRFQLQRRDGLQGALESDPGRALSSSEWSSASSDNRQRRACRERSMTRRFTIVCDNSLSASAAGTRLGIGAGASNVVCTRSSASCDERVSAAAALRSRLFRSAASSPTDPLLLLVANATPEVWPRGPTTAVSAVTRLKNSGGTVANSDADRKETTKSIVLFTRRPCDLCSRCSRALFRRREFPPGAQNARLSSTRSQPLSVVRPDQIEARLPPGYIITPVWAARLAIEHRNRLPLVRRAEVLSERQPGRRHRDRDADVADARLVPGRALLFGLATFETAIGACFVAGAYRRVALLLLIAHMLGTGLPFLLFPGQLFNHSVLVPTFLGQYILKNIIIVSAALVLLRRWR